MMTTRRAWLAAATAAAAFPSLARADKPLRIVVPFPPGGPTDFIARLLATALGEASGRTVIVDNRAGASGNIGTQSVLEAPADGLTLAHYTVAVQAINPIMYPSAKLEPARDFVPIALTGAMPNVLVVHPTKLGVGSLAELVELGRRQPGRLTCATFGSGTSPHIYGALLQKLAGFTATIVPYRGSPLALNDVIGGVVDFVFDNMTTCMSHVQAGTLRGLAVTSPTRHELLPAVPTMAQAGYPAFDLKFWFALVASARTPASMVEQLRALAAKVVNDPNYIKALRSRGAEPQIVAADNLVRFTRDDGERWARIARDIGIKPEGNS